MLKTCLLAFFLQRTLNKWLGDDIRNRKFVRIHRANNSIQDNTVPGFLFQSCAGYGLILDFAQ